jgi:sec-independent protein translocase protein TatB
MFDLDIGKMLVVCAVALVVVGPKDLPRVLRAVGQILARAKRFRNDLQQGVTRFANEADLGSIDRELAAVESRARVNFSLDPAMTMRGRLPSDSVGDTTSQEGENSAPQYTSPQMAAYLEAPPERTSRARVDGSHAELAAVESRTGCVPNCPVGGEADRSMLI